MRGFLSSVFILTISISFGQKLKPDKQGAIICPLPIDCVRILNGNPIKPFKTGGLYFGKVIIKANLDTVTLRLTGHKIIFASLYSKKDFNKKIRLSTDEQQGDIKYLYAILPALITHLKYLKFTIIGRADCAMSSSWYFPVTIK